MAKQINRVSLHTSIDASTQSTLKALSNDKGLNQGRIIDYLCNLYIDQILKDNKNILESIEFQFKSDLEAINEAKKLRLKQINKDSGKDTDISGIF